MIYGVGTDILEISRMKKSMKSKRFVKKVFSSEEIEYFKEKNFPPQTLAANFCGKEAFAKSLGTGVRGFSLNEVSILRDGLGKPYVKLTGKALKIGAGLDFLISLSHSKEYATAFVVAQKGKEG